MSPTTQDPGLKSISAWDMGHPSTLLRTVSLSNGGTWDAGIGIN